VSALGLTVLEDDRDRPTHAADGHAADGEELAIVDAGSYPDSLRTCVESSRRSGSTVVIVASAAEAEIADLGGIVRPDIIVSKPVHRDALYEALAAAMGEPPLAGVEGLRSAPGEPCIGGHVLLVEDEPVNAAVASGYLAELGCTCVWVESGPAAIARSAIERFDLILMDLSMPTMDGFSTTALIRQREGQVRRVPIVALTAHDAAGYRESWNAHSFCAVGSRTSPPGHRPDHRCDPPLTCCRASIPRPSPLCATCGRESMPTCIRNSWICFEWDLLSL
jgi:CheY-like chemotaxis protein